MRIKIKVTQTTTREYTDPEKGRVIYDAHDVMEGEISGANAWENAEMLCSVLQDYFPNVDIEMNVFKTVDLEDKGYVAVQA